jgi:uncharacterized protein YbbC (DUF1343 family)
LTRTPATRHAEGMLASAAMVLCGLDVLVRADFEPLKGRKIGLICNHTTLTRDGRHAIDAFYEAKGIELKALFAPEHGIRGTKDEAISDEKDAKTGLPIYSLYNLKEKGEARYKPNPDQLKGLDTLVFDIQDIGARFYTYTSTMGYAMEAAAENGLKFVVLDRPNPIGGIEVEGAVSDPEFRGHTAYHTIPTRHGMTAGELALMYKSVRKINVDLQVIKAEGWTRKMWWDETGLEWVNPSPNMRSLNAALLYPGICLIEAGNVSVGRGTDDPFERIGAPYIKGQDLAIRFNALGLAGIKAYPVRFTPTSSKFVGVECQGMAFSITDRAKFRPVRVGFEIARLLNQLYPEYQEETLIRLVQNRAAAEAALKPGPGVPKEWSAGVDAFKKFRKDFLLYE